MQAILNKLKVSSQYCAAGAWIAVVGFLAAGLCAPVANAQTAPNVVLSQLTKLGALAGGGAQSGAVPDGDSFAVNSAGDVLVSDTYGNNIELFNGTTGAESSVGAPGNPAGVAVDSHDNLYIGFSYNSAILKIPYLGGTYAIGAPVSGGNPYPAGTPNCTGTDTVECVMNNATAGGSNLISLAFDAQGDLFYATTGNVIWECTAACLYTGTPAPVMIYSEPAAATVSGSTAKAQLIPGGLSVDPWGNLFFTDSAIDTSTSQKSYSSNVNELVYTAGTGYAAAPTVLYTFTPASVSQYGPEINGVVTDANGTVYFLMQNTGGVFGFPSNKGVIDSTKMFTVSTEQGKLLSIDNNGNLYVVGNDSSVNRLSINNLTATASLDGTTSTATNITTILNDEDCTGPPAVTFAASENGTSTTEFSAATSGACSSTMTNGAAQATTLTFTPTATGLRTGTLTALDTDGNSGTANLVGLGDAGATAQTITFATLTSPAPYDPTGFPLSATASSGLPVTFSVLSGPAVITGGNTLTPSGLGTVVVAADQPGNATYAAAAEVTQTVVVTTAGPAATPTFSVPADTYTTAQTVTLSDATVGATIYYTTDGSTPTTSSTVFALPLLVASTQTINAIAVAPGYDDSAVGSAAYTVNLTSSGPPPTVAMSQVTAWPNYPAGGAYGGSTPAGTSFGVDPKGDLIIGTSYGGTLVEYDATTGAATTLGSMSNVGGVAVDKAGNIYAGDSAYGLYLVKVPLVSGSYPAVSSPTGSTPACTGSDTTECALPALTTGLGSAGGYTSMVFDAAGDLFFVTTSASTTGNGIYECNVACLSSATPAATLLYQETAAATFVGGIAVDPWGDVFFTESVTDTSNENSSVSTLDELVYSGTAYASTPTLLYSFTPGSTGSYDDQLDGVAVDETGVVYFATQYEGIFAFPNNRGVVDTSTLYTVSTQGGKILTTDGKGNFYEATYSGGDAAVHIAIGTLTLPTTGVGTPSSASNVTTILNDVGCSASPTVSFAATEGGASTTEFSAATSGSCSSTMSGASALATTVDFNPSASGTRVALLTATDSNGGTSTANAIGLGHASVLTPQTIMFTAPGPANYGTTVSLTATASSNLPVALTVVSGPATISGSTLTPTGVGTVIVAADQAGNGTYGAAPEVLQSVVINQASQTITFPALTAVTYGATVPLAATSDSGLPVTFSVVSGPGTISGSTLTPTGIGAIVVAADQAGNSNYAAATEVTQSVNINAVGTVATPTFSPGAGTINVPPPQTVTISDATSGATIYYTTDGSTPTTSSTAYSGAITLPSSAMTETIQAIAVETGYTPSSVASAAYTINVIPPGLTLSFGESSLTIAKGIQYGTDVLTVTPMGGFTGPVNFACSGVPVGVTCSFSSTPLIISGGPATTTVTISRTTTAGLDHRSNPLLPEATLALALCFFGFRRRRGIQIALLVMISVLGLSMLSGCGSSSSNKPSNSTITITATAGTLSATTTVTVAMN
jgi:hypothetical protein